MDDNMEAIRGMAMLMPQGSHLDAVEERKRTIIWMALLADGLREGLADHIPMYAGLAETTANKPFHVQIATMVEAMYHALAAGCHNDILEQMTGCQPETKQ